jgi:hypothetical protein
MRRILICLALAMLAGCGAQQQRAYGIDQETLLVVRATQLVGATLTVEPSYKAAITKQDLTPYKFGIPGAADTENETLETVTIKVTPGTHRVKIELDGQVLLDQDLYFGQGQTRELRVR